MKVTDSQAPSGYKAVPPAKEEASNRKQRRGFQSGVSYRPRFRRTGTPPHFAAWMADLKVKSTLQKMRTAWIADRIEDPALSQAYGIAATKYKTVWDLSQADGRELAALKGMGPVRMKALAADLRTHQVEPKWAGKP